MAESRDQSATDIRAVFDAASELTAGVEEELLRRRRLLPGARERA